MTSPILSVETSHSNGNAPASSMVLKNIGAILLPIQIPPKRLFGTNGISSPVYHNTELVADLREEPVPTTSPTKATGWPFFFSSLICCSAPLPSAGLMPGRAFLYMALACKGISGRDQASCAG